jgi:predicted metal-dependent peptidase
MFSPYVSLKLILRENINNTINVIIDTSGSCIMPEYKIRNDFFNILFYILNKKYSINLIQIDTQINSISTLKGFEDLLNLKLSGGCGTKLQPAIDYIVDSRNRLNTNSTVLLTDSLFDTLNFKHYHNNVLIVVDEIIENRIIGNSKFVKQVLSK